MLVVGFPAQAFGTNCFVVASGPGEQCVVIDPGIGVIDQLDSVLAEHRLHPAAVMLTHGHLDHTFSVTPVCKARGVTAYIHPRDREMLADPTKALSIDTRAMFGGLEWSEPDDIAEMTDGMVLEIAGLSILVDHAPGHTGGSVMFRLSTSPRRAALLLRRRALSRQHWPHRPAWRRPERDDGESARQGADPA